MKELRHMKAGILDKISKYRNNFIHHVKRMQRNILSKVLTITNHRYYGTKDSL
jgi:hypothetical protein